MNPRVGCRLLRFLRGRGIVLIDQVVSSSSNIVVLLVAAHLLVGRSFSEYALFQLVVTSMISMQRSVLLSPSLSVQRSAGRTYIPVRWLAVGGIPGAAIVVTLSALVHSPSGIDGIAWLVVAAATGFAALAQDLMRYRALAGAQPWVSLVSDSLWLVVSAGVLLFLQIRGDRESIASVALAWGAGALVGLLAAIFLQLASRSRRMKLTLMPAKLSGVWRLGRWAAIDSGLSTVTILLPMFVATLTIASAQSGMYRVLQTSTSPLNLLNTTLILVFGLEAWKLIDETTLGALKVQVRRIRLSLVGVALVVICIEPVVLLVAGLPIGSAAVVPMLVVGVSAIMGAWISPEVAAAQALGYQRFGAVIRLVSFAATSAISVLALLKIPIVSGDPVGVAVATGSTIGLIGWEIAYRRAVRVEFALLKRSEADLVAARGDGK